MSLPDLRDGEVRPMGTVCSSARKLITFFTNCRILAISQALAQIAQLSGKRVKFQFSRRL